MATALFIALTASDAWLTAEEIVTLLDQGGYWSDQYLQASPDERLSHVVSQLETLSDAAGRPLFEHITSLGPDNQPVVLYKQARLIERERRRRGPDRPPP